MNSWPEAAIKILVAGVRNLLYNVRLYSGRGKLDDFVMANSFMLPTILTRTQRTSGHPYQPVGRFHGYWRPVIRTAIDKFLKCGDLREGFARVRCLGCGKEFFRSVFVQTALLLPMLRSEASSVAGYAAGGGGICSGLATGNGY